GVGHGASRRDPRPREVAGPAPGRRLGARPILALRPSRVLESPRRDARRPRGRDGPRADRLHRGPDSARRPSSRMDRSPAGARGWLGGTAGVRDRRAGPLAARAPDGVVSSAPETVAAAPGRRLVLPVFLFAALVAAVYGDTLFSRRVFVGRDLLAYN